MNKKIALIGGGGFIGTNLANYLKNSSFEIKIITKRPIVRRNFQDDDIEEILINVNNTNELISSVKDCEYIVWLVNELVPAATMNSVVDDFIFNTTSLVHFLEKSSELKKLEKFIYISSGGTIYGDAGDFRDLKEQDPKVPISAYGLSKIVSEQYIDYFSRKSDFKCLILRPSNVYGKFQNFSKPQGIIGFTLNAVMTDKSINLFDKGKIYRDFIYVDDLASAVKSLILQPSENINIEIYNVGSQKPTAIFEVLNLIEKVTQKEIHLNHKPARSFDCIYNVLDISKLHDHVGWKPVVELEEGLVLVWEWIQQQHNN
ncbi:NAD-dependent epimerase/dehydratase family protein [Kaistella antarctica]|uniref:dTDP-glucose 4,6-dehydratase n=1 Tax=Kaistella antarctica TaxID=266748 RepID=A0A3S4YT61_9FLAO|nr:NAD-dependent epimerase/dehydratase family protein [Kaistella antarctica]KEY18825.1 hypothetical protein HY04_10160 [Kaistella antarctica]SEW14986.1 UDP-glucose 4-epimerase [Kaistella antarctica]VEH99420.1 dTDP-glucose 4,6-dehydratase [Kaistella antarctica]